MGEFFLKGFTLGFAIAAPVGPVSLLCVQRTIAQGRVIGLLSGLGAALADGVCSWVAALGFTFISTVLLVHAGSLKLAGGLILVVIGLGLFVHRPRYENTPRPAAGLMALATTFVLTLANPTTLVAFLAACAGLELVCGGTSDVVTASLVAGVFAGSATWWCLLCVGAERWRWRLDTLRLAWLNRTAGTLLILFGFAAIFAALATAAAAR